MFGIIAMITTTDLKSFAERFGHAVTARAAGMNSVECYFAGFEPEASRRALQAIADEPLLTAMASLSLKLSLLGGFSCLTSDEASAINDFFDEENFVALKDSSTDEIKDAILKAANLASFAKELLSKTFPELNEEAGRQSIKVLVRHGQEWRTNEPAIDDEHDSFNALVVRLLAVACSSTNTTIIRGTFETLKTRMRIHAEAEETFARKFDPETADILGVAHEELFSSVETVGQAIGRVSRSEFLNLVGKVGMEIEKHESEIDVPLFRLIRKTYFPEL